MSLLKLSGIGKIYVSDSTVAVGIRGVNLEFDRGEFVAITGQSGSGKSTLLNVISGMDSYEEGELYIEGEPTSHYTQADWEKYREKYISFIFQEYNIIDSFTVLENVELALMHISNPVERHQRALELIKRVGLENHIKHKGSQLSGGQKQRTVIARALAKDSPIILADEPTGNLDSETSKEIISLLKEVSKDKLLIVVTHNFDEVKEHATREIRVYEHGIASDIEMNPEKNLSGEKAEEKTDAKPAKHHTARNSAALGFTVFKSKPRLSVFICLLLLVASAVLFFLFSAFWADIRVLFLDENYMFTPMEGRLVVVKSDGSAMTEEELKGLAEKTGADDIVRFDRAFDMFSISDWRQFYPHYDRGYFYSQSGIPVNVTFYDDGIKPDIGRMPETEDEALLCLPYFMRDIYGTDTIEMPSFAFGSGINISIVGIHYYIDSNVQGKLIMTRSGFEKMSLLAYATRPDDLMCSSGGGSRGRIFFDTAVPEGKIYLNENDSREKPESIALIKSMDPMRGTIEPIGFTFEQDDIEIRPLPDSYYRVNPKSIMSALESFAASHYRQATLMYSSDKKAAEAADVAKDMGYIAALSNTTYKLQSYLEIAELIVMAVVYLALWALLLIFLSFFLRICTKKSMDAFKSDIAIMRSMGIRVREIKAAVYIRIIICILPSIILLPIGAYFVYRTDFGGRHLVFLYAPQYIVIYLLLLLVIARVAKRHVANLFSENVRKALKEE